MRFLRLEGYLELVERPTKLVAPEKRILALMKEVSGVIGEEGQEYDQLGPSNNHEGKKGLPVFLQFFWVVLFP